MTDPITKTGLPAHGPSAAAAVLDGDRTLVTLNGLVPPTLGVQSLASTFVNLTEVSPPSVFPTEVSPFEFRYVSRTDSFAAANAYHHCDGFFRMMQDMGFIVASYFNNTTFPVPVDHMIGNFINAFCNGNGGGNGIGNVIFALADTTDVANPIGIAADWRVVCHEIGGHGILWDNANSPNFGFAHSAGDSVGAILNDPGSQAADRFETFPFTFLSLPLSSRRRHDRPATASWGWHGANDVGGYDSEQILCTTLFRLYRSMGGDAASLGTKLFAARFATYLIFKAVGLVTSGSTPQPENFELFLESADALDWVSTTPPETHAGGAYFKVIRWAFEKQGMFRAAGDDPETTEGRPPDVDVYIDDGRAGEYQYLPNHWSCTDIWNRTTIGDGGGVHENPIVGQTNYAYVRIKNRGTQMATGVVVKGFHCLPGVGLVYPNDWAAMTTPQLVAPNLAAGDNVGVVVGPFDWTPSQVGHECMFFSVSATNDPSNIDGRVVGPIPEWRLVPHDNNIGQRNVIPVPALTGRLAAVLAGLPFWVGNPFERRVKITLTPTLPKFLTGLGWELGFASAGGGRFSLAPGANKKVELRMKEGRPFTPDMVQRGGADTGITITAHADDMLIGGMTYQLDSRFKDAGLPRGDRCDKLAEELVDGLGIPRKRVKSVKIRRVTLDIDFYAEDNC